MAAQVPIVLAHGRAAELEIAPTMSRLRGDALVQGLQRVGSEFADRVRVEYAYFGGLWREDATKVMPRFVDEAGAAWTVALTPKPHVEKVPAGEEQALPGLGRLSGVLMNNTPDFLLEGILRQAIPDVFEYLSDPVRRGAANEIVLDACTRSGAPVLVGFSMGSVVGYDTLRDMSGGSKVKSFVTCGSPIGLKPIRKELLDTNGETRFPAGMTTWMNIWKSDDVATGIHGDDLRALFPGGTIQEARAFGRPPSVRNPFAAHNALDYLSSLPMGLALHLAIKAAAPD
jgi:hypothetical protein